MISKITQHVLDAQQHCRLKAYFRLCGEAGVKSEFEKLEFDAQRAQHVRALAKIRRRCDEEEIKGDIDLSLAALRKGIPFILDGRMEDDRYLIRFDGLKRVSGASILGDFHYQPVMFSAGRRVRKPERHRLAVWALLLSRLQGALPDRGILYLGPDCATTNIRFGTALPAAENELRDAGRLQRATVPPVSCAASARRRSNDTRGRDCSR
jgi:predicted RecB family nuclease